MCKRLLGLLIAAAASAAAAPALAEDRVALVIGNSAYETTGWALANPANDARLIADTLEDLDFDVTLVTDASLEDMEEAFAAHGARLSRAGQDAVGLIYYAGHAVQSQGRNYLLPVDQQIATEQDVWRKGAQVSLAIEYLQAAANRINFIILDACRNNPLPSAARGVGGGLAQSQRMGGVLIAYATAPGQTAMDGAGGNSPFTQALADLLPTPGLPAELLFKRVGDRVLVLTGREQQSWYESGLSGADFCFAGCEWPSGEPPAALVGVIEEPGVQAAFDAEDLLWDVARVVGTREGLENYLTRYPDGRHAANARQQLAAMGEPTDRSLTGREGESLAEADRIRVAQVLLAAMGYEPGPFDGRLGARTADAIDAFRRAYGADVGREVDPRFLDALRSAIAEGHRALSGAAASVTAPSAALRPNEVALIAGPTPTGTTIARPTSEHLLGRWCDSAGTRTDERSQRPIELAVTESQMTYVWSGGARERYDIAAITPRGDVVEVEWRVGQERMITVFGQFTGDAVTQLRGRRVGDAAWNEYGRVLVRCD